MTKVDANSPAWMHGIRPGDIIVGDNDEESPRFRNSLPSCRRARMSSCSTCCVATFRLTIGIRQNVRAVSSISGTSRLSVRRYNPYFMVRSRLFMQEKNHPQQFDYDAQQIGKRVPLSGPWRYLASRNITACRCFPIRRQAAMGHVRN